MSNGFGRSPPSYSKALPVDVAEDEAERADEEASARPGAGAQAFVRAKAPTPGGEPTALLDDLVHEMINSLTVMALQVHLLKMDPSAPLTESQRESVELLEQQVRRLGRHVRSMHDVTRP